MNADSYRVTFDDAAKDAEAPTEEDLGSSAVFAPIEREPKPTEEDLGSSAVFAPIEREPKPAEELSEAQIEKELASDVREPAKDISARISPDPSPPVENRERSEKVKTRQAKKFDFRQPKTLERNQLRSLQLLLEAFARPASSILSANLRVHCRLDITGLLQLPWEGVLDMFEDNGSVTVVSLPPLPAKAIYYQQFDPALRIVDLRFGGSGEDIPSRTMLTDIELDVVLGIMEEVLAQLPAAFSSILDIRLGQITQEQSLQLVHAAAMNEMCIVAKMVLRIDDKHDHETALILPFPLLRPMLDQLGSRGVAVVEQSLGFANKLAERLQDVDLDLEVVFKPTYLSSGQIVDLRPGDVVRLAHRKGEPLDLVCGPVKVSKVQPTQVGRRLACLVVEGIEVE